MNPEIYLPLVERALYEDLDQAGDITSDTVIAADARSTAQLVAREQGVVAGLEVAAYVFHVVDDAVRVTTAEDGSAVSAGDVIGSVDGASRSILKAERTALNLLGRMSGVATATASYVAAVAGSGARIMDTRKTMPGMRALDKYAVTVGGGVNHRMGLYDAVMIKDNHIVAAGGIGPAVAKARAALPEVEIVVEVETLSQLEEALTTSADRVLLDNMPLPLLGEAVELCQGQVETEASGGIDLGTVGAVAATGVDFISVGAITHSAPQLDIALDFVS